VSSLSCIAQDFWAVARDNPDSGESMPFGQPLRIRCALNAALVRSLRDDKASLERAVDRLRDQVKTLHKQSRAAERSRNYY
jgi:hypothetical protein